MQFVDIGIGDNALPKFMRNGDITADIFNKPFLVCAFRQQLQCELGILLLQVSAGIENPEELAVIHDRHKVVARFRCS